MNRITLMAILSGLLLTSGNRFPELWFLSFFSFIPLMWILINTHSVKEVCKPVFITGIVAYGLSLHALFWDTLPLDWLGIEGLMAPFLIFIIWSITTVSYALIFALGMALAKYLLTYDFKDLFLVSSIYILIDWLTAWVFSLINYGPSSLIGAHFTISSPAYQLASSEAILQLTTLGGIYALLGIQASVGILIFFAFSKKEKLRYKARIALAIFLISWLILSIWVNKYTNDKTGEPVNVGVVSIFKPPDTKNDSRSREDIWLSINSQIESASRNTDYILLPEDSRFVKNLENKTNKKWIERLPETTLVDSATTRENDGKLYSRISYYNTTLHKSDYYYKEYLMIFGEYMPYLYKFLGTILGQKDLLEDIKKDRAMNIKEDTDRLHNNSFKTSTRLCSDAMSPSIYREQTKKGADILFNLASHTWFHHSKALHELSKRIGKTRAAETRRWYVRSGIDSPSFISNPYGRIVAEADWNEEDLIKRTVYTNSYITFYTYVGKWVLLIPFLIIFWFFIRKFISK